MRKIYTLLFVAILMISCEGTVGPPGPPGPPGQDGLDGSDGISGQFFEFEADLNIGMNFEYFVEIPDEIIVLESDVVVVYRLMEVFDGTDVWEPLPQTIFRDNGILLYGFDYTISDVRLFLDGTVNFGNLDPNDTDGLIFRIAVIPVDFAKSMNLKKMEEVIDALNVDEIKRVN